MITAPEEVDTSHAHLLALRQPSHHSLDNPTWRIYAYSRVVVPDWSLTYTMAVRIINYYHDDSMIMYKQVYYSSKDTLLLNVK